MNDVSYNVIFKVLFFNDLFTQACCHKISTTPYFNRATTFPTMIGASTRMGIKSDSLK